MLQSACAFPIATEAHSDVSEVTTRHTTVINFDRWHYALNITDAQYY
jgi:hypothetical protein